jgi:hypothetical protein
MSYSPRPPYVRNRRHQPRQRRNLANHGFAAKFPGKCDVCREPFDKGDLICGATGAYSHKGCVYPVTTETYGDV